MSITADISVKLIFSDTVSLVLTASNYIQAYSLLIEMDNQPESLTGSISANELTFSLDNNSNVFSPTNTTSPYYGLMGQGVKVLVYRGVDIVGTYFITKWDAPANAGKRVAKITAVDKLQNVLNSPVSLVNLEKDITVKDYLTKAFLSVGLTEGELGIDPSLTQVLNFTLANGAKLSSILNDVSTSADCYVYMDGLGRIIVRPKEITGAATKSLTESTNLVEAIPSKSILQSSNVLQVGFSLTSISAVKSLLSLPQQEIKAGDSTIDNLKFTNGNVFDIDSVKVSSFDDIICKDVIPTQSTILLHINNPATTTKTASFDIYGRTIEYSSSYVEQANQLSVTANGRQELKVDCKLVQTKESADALLAKLWSRATRDVPYIKATIKDSDFLYSLGDIVNVTATLLDLSYKGFVHSVRYTWNGGDSVKGEVGIKFAP